VALQVFGLNAWAWQQQRAIEQRKQAQSALLKSAHPQVRTVLDAPLQMQRETALLRARAGQVGEADLEAAWGAAAAAWPEGAAPAQALRYEAGRLVLTVTPWSEPQQRAFRERLRAAGWSAEVAGSSVTMRRAATAAVGAGG
jgi:general secretion pathway protein L